MNNSARTRVLGYGRGESANHVGYRLVDRALSGTSSELTFTRPLERGGDTVRVTSPFAGEAQALDFLCALACAESVEAPFATDELERALASVELEGRATLRERPDGALVIDDTYNANPASMQSALRMASELAVARNARLVVVLGEMKELGEHAVREHEALGTHVEAAKAALFIGTGGLTEKATARARALGVRVLDAASAEEASMLALREVSAKDVVLVKASRSVRAEQIVHALLSSA